MINTWLPLRAIEIERYIAGWIGEFAVFEIERSTLDYFIDRYIHLIDDRPAWIVRNYG